MAINIISEKCKGCGICIKECPFEALSMENVDGKKVAQAGMACTNCGVCVEKCPSAPLSAAERAWLM
jgi:electron transfer flavoprotein alpha subunit